MLYKNLKLIKINYWVIWNSLGMSRVLLQCKWMHYLKIKANCKNYKKKFFHYIMIGMEN